MTQKILFALWGCLFILCAGLGFIPEPEGALRLLLTAVSLAFFLPPVLILQDAEKKQDTAAVKLIRKGKAFVCCGDGWLELTEITPASKKKMSGETWLRGIRGEAKFF